VVPIIDAVPSPDASTPILVEDTADDNEGTHSDVDDVDAALVSAKRFKEEELQAAEAMPTTRSSRKRAPKKLERPTKRAEYITPNCRKVPLSNMRFVGQYLPERAANRQHCYWCRIQATKTRAGQTNTMCSQCKIFLCTFPCYHTAETRETRSVC